ncbi:gluconate 5-dehydrogenase [Niallia nealsonii]|uniref:Gluconate 5-dehydrogenase n=1 Tax=Niallia nealsonii TaxID=115979 RepID=A0A2N0YZX3_9BACI|nr:gluconate 5-dehydrogenase [Niallia nealsonii]
MENNIFSLENKTIIITGGSGHLGSSMAESFVKYGARVYLASRNNDKNADFSRYLANKYKTDVFYIKMDTNNSSSVKEAINHIMLKEKKIDVVVNNAYNGKTGEMLTGTESDWMSSYDGSIHSTYRVIKEVLPIMVSQKSGSIINIASMYGVVSPNPYIYGESGQNSPPHYGSAKAAIIHFTKYLAGHFGKEGIRVNCISPGPFPNEQTQQHQKEFMAQLCEKNPMGRIGKPEELQGIAVLLASDASSYITGQNICVDGGWTIW